MCKMLISAFLFTGIFLFFNIAEAQDSIPSALTAPLHLTGMPELDERILASSNEGSVSSVVPLPAEVEVEEEIKLTEPQIEGQLKTVQ